MSAETGSSMGQSSIAAGASHGESLASSGAQLGVGRQSSSIGSFMENNHTSFQEMSRQTGPRQEMGARNLLSLPHHQITTPFESDRQVPGNLAFTHTQVEVKNSGLQSPKLSEHTATETRDTTQPPSLQSLEKQLDEEQADKVMEVMKKAGFSETEAREKTDKILNEKAKKATDDQALDEAKADEPKKEKDELKEDEERHRDEPTPVFEQDPEATYFRKLYARIALKQSIQELKKGELDEITGATLAERMPQDPQPHEIKSEIVKKEYEVGKDHSYPDVLAALRIVGKLRHAREAITIFDQKIDAMPPVRVGTGGGNAVTEDDADRVMGKKFATSPHMESFTKPRMITQKPTIKTGLPKAA